MQKEVIIAIVFGSLLGLLVAFGVWRANMSLNSDDIPNDPVTTTTQDTTENIIPELSVVSPESNAVITDSTVTISGLSSNSRYVIAMSQNAETINEIQNGEFSFDIELEGGLNNIYIYGVSDTGNIISQNLPLVYTTNLESNDDNESEEDINERVQERLNEQANPITSYIGTITDITEEYFQIRSQSGEINQLTVNEQTTYTSNIQDSRDIEFSDVAIGDFIVAMGRLDANEILNTQRVIITSPPVENNYLVSKGVVTDITRNEMAINSDKSEIIFRLGNNTDYLEATNQNEIARADIEIDSEVLIAGEQNGDTISARSVFVLTF